MVQDLFSDPLVHLNGNAFKGPLPPFQHMLNLQLLDLGNNFFEGEVPPLPRSLELLDLSHNDFVARQEESSVPLSNEDSRWFTFDTFGQIEVTVQG